MDFEAENQVNTLSFTIFHSSVCNMLSPTPNPLFGFLFPVPHLGEAVVNMSYYYHYCSGTTVRKTNRTSNITLILASKRLKQISRSQL